MKAHINTTVDIDSIDVAASPSMQIEIMPAPGGQGVFTLYIHEEGRTVVRVSKLKRPQIQLDMP